MLTITIIFTLIAKKYWGGSLLRKEVRIVIATAFTWSICFIIRGLTGVLLRTMQNSEEKYLYYDLITVNLYDFVPIGMILGTHFYKFMRRKHKEMHHLRYFRGSKPGWCKIPIL